MSFDGDKKKNKQQNNCDQDFFYRFFKINYFSCSKL